MNKVVKRRSDSKKGQMGAILFFEPSLFLKMNVDLVAELYHRQGHARGRLPIIFAHVIAEWRNGKDSLVVSLYGDWGSGKSSLKEMVLEALKSHQNPPGLLEFNPWNWAAQEKSLKHSTAR